MAARKLSVPDAPRRHVDCAYAPACGRHAMFREKLPTGWAILCEFHYVEEHKKRAKAWCEERGLFTAAQQKAYCANLVGLFKPMLVAREPGQDDEERAS